jgi:integrase
MYEWKIVRERRSGYGVRRRMRSSGDIYESATLRRKLSALSSLFDSLCEKNAVTHNPVDGVKRPTADNNQGKTPAIDDLQARALLAAPQGESLKALRDRAILAVLLYHGFRRDELCRLKVQDYQRRDGIMHFRADGKGGKVRYIPVAALAQRLVTEYLDAAGHGEDSKGALFRPVKNNVTRTLSKACIRRQSIRTLCSTTRERLGFPPICTGSACIAYARPLRPMRWLTAPTLLKFRNGSATRMSLPRGSTIKDRRGPRIAPRLRSGISGRTCSTARVVR